jgi:hypothetical protein
MRGRDTIIVVTCLALAAGLLFLGGTQLDYINAQRQEMDLVTNAPLENAPPSLAFATVAMGAFRGLVVDILWMRADTLKEEGQFFDALQLAQWITTLQPRFAAVWEFHAWNMAYNISVAIPASQPEQRWRWVRNGYELLRDKGIPTNPKSIRLYRELARIFQHKLGGVSDDVHKYYKLHFASEIAPLLWSEDNDLLPDDNAFFEALIGAPKTWEQVANDPNLAPFITALQSADEVFSDADEFVQNYLVLRRRPKRFTPAAFEVIDAYRGTPALKRFDIFAKAYTLRHTWKMDPALMQEVNQTYGPVSFRDPNTHFPFDWRHPDSHAIYWAVKGLKVASEKKDGEYTSHETNTDRIVAHSLQNLFLYGRIMLDEGLVRQAPEEAAEAESGMQLMRRDIFLGPDLRMFKSYHKALLKILDKYKDDRGRRETWQNGHRNMLKNAVLSFYQAGLKAEALKVYNQLRGYYAYDEFKVSLEQYVVDRFRYELDSIGINDARDQITALLAQAYSLYALRDDEGAAGNEQMAQQVYDYYNEQLEPEYRVDLPRMRMLRYYSIGQFLNSGAYPPYVCQRLLDRIQIEKPELFEQLKQTGAELNQQMQKSQGTP